MAKQQPIRTVAVAVRLNFQSGRDILYGISRFAQRHCRWRFHIITDPQGPSAHELFEPEKHGIDGIIADSVPNADILPSLRASRVPLVLIGERSPEIGKRRTAIAFVLNDDADVGTMGARHLYSLGRFKSYGFVPHVHHNYCTDARERGFMEFFGSVGRTASVYRVPAGVPAGSLKDVEALTKWLEGLPKPAAVMAIHDLRATSIMEAAHAARIRIPRDLALIGVDNDELLCDFTDPPLTSIAVDHIHEGELAAKALYDMIRGKAPRNNGPVLNTRKTLIERKSAKPMIPGSGMVEQAQDFIRREATNGITAADVAKHLGASRRLADMRFRQFTGKSILEAIIEQRLAVLKRRLSESAVPIEKTIALCGFNSPSYAKRLFKARTGMTMSDYRRG